MEIERYKIGIILDNAGNEIDRVKVEDASKFNYKAYTDRMPIKVKWYTCTITHDELDVVVYDRPGKESK